VVSNRGPSYRCEVAWTGPDGASGGGWFECERQPGDHVQANAMGWPRRGTAQDTSTAVVLASLGAFLGLMMAGLTIGVSAMQLRRLARHGGPEP
jgi:hypothetical protein